MKVNFEGSLEEFTAVFRGLALEFELQDDEDVIEDLEFVPTEVKAEKKPTLPMFMQDKPTDVPTGKGAIPFPQNKAFSGDMKDLTPKERTGCLEAATYFFQEWTKGFGEPEAEQANRVELIETMGSGQWTVPFLVLCYEYGSLQKFCGVCLKSTHRGNHESEGAWWEWIDSIACNIVQVSVAGFPDVQGTYDYSTRWKREALGET